jgi:dTDP-4-dehydrorhamnose reductase
MHISGTGMTTWYEFASEIFRQSQSEVRVISGTTEMLGRPAPRPVNSAMVSERDETPKLPRWDHGLHEYLLERTERDAAAALTSNPNEEGSE